MLSPSGHGARDKQPAISLAHLDCLDLHRAADGWHGIWQVDGVMHQFWLPNATPDAAVFYVVVLPMDTFLELRAHAARRFWRSLNGRKPGPDYRALPAQLRQWHILSLRTLDARQRGESYRTIAVPRHEGRFRGGPAQEQGPPTGRTRHQDDARRLSPATALPNQGSEMIIVPARLITLKASIQPKQFAYDQAKRV